MTLRSRINQRSDRSSARAERATSRRRAAIEAGVRVLARLASERNARLDVGATEPVAAPIVGRATEPATEETRPRLGTPLIGTAACWDAPCSSLRATPMPTSMPTPTPTPTPRQTTSMRRTRNALTTAPVDWSAVRENAAT
jgi:hypothetical protein